RDGIAPVPARFGSTAGHETRRRPRPAILRNRYVLAVPDVRASADFYVRALGFAIVDEPPGVGLRGARQRGDHAGRVARTPSGIESKPWGMREFTVRTPDGHRIAIGHVIHASRAERSSA
ncbi:MAG TPA: VOC family protein, partial [Longimicrobium sp.]|nr:VOC family protein [Longimicrobium sp.]